MITRRAGLFGSLAVATLHRPARAQPVATLLIGSPAGSPMDRIGRVFAACLHAHMPSRDITIRNLPGEAGWTMLSALGSAQADGSVLGWISTPNLLARSIDRDNPELIRHIQMVGRVEREPVAFVSPASAPLDSVQDVIRRAADDSDAIPMATPPAGSPPHLAALRLQALAQTHLNILPFPSAPAAVQAILAGNVSAAALGLSDVIDAIRDGRLSAIGIAARRRFGLLPDTPVLNEAGIPLSAFISRGVAVPVGTPVDIVAPLAQALQAVVADEALQSEAQANGYHLSWKSGATWAAEAEAERAELSKLWETDPWLKPSGGSSG